MYHGWGGDKLRQVALDNSQQSLKNGKQIFSLLKAAGTADPDASKAFRNLYRNIENPTVLGKIKDGIQDQREHFGNLGLHIGYVYGDQTISQNASTYKPSRAPGARLPHTWINYVGPNSLTNQLSISFIYRVTRRPENSQPWICARTMLSP